VVVVGYVVGVVEGLWEIDWLCDVLSDWYCWHVMCGYLYELVGDVVVVVDVYSEVVWRVIDVLECDYFVC